MQEMQLYILNVKRNVVNNFFLISIFIFFGSSCNDERVDKVEAWQKRFCKCVNMPTRDSQIGCTDTWRAEMKKELNADEQKRCWELVDKVSCDDNK
jgi:hypothetical protein